MIENAQAIADACRLAEQATDLASYLPPGESKEDRMESFVQAIATALASIALSLAYRENGTTQ